MAIYATTTCTYIHVHAYVCVLAAYHDNGDDGETVGVSDREQAAAETSVSVSPRQ